MTDELDCVGNVARRRGFLQAGMVRLSYLEWGTAGRPLLLLHGITSSAATWWRVAPELARAGYHVYALDMPGHGESQATAEHAIDATAALVGAALRALSMEQATLIGHSWGGATALALASAAARRPRLTRVALIDPALRMSAAWGAEHLPTYSEGVGEPPEVNLPRLRANSPDWHECELRWKAEALAQCRLEQVRGFFAGSGDWELTPRLGAVEAPLLMLVADPQHTVVAPEVLAEARAALRPELGTLLQIPGTTHSMQRGAGYTPTMAALREWLEMK